MGDIPKYIREGLDKQDADTLAEIADLAEQLAAEKVNEVESELEQASEDEEDLPDEVLEHDLDADVPPGTSVFTTIKTIDGNDYYYKQWREGDKVKSEYVCPKNPKYNKY